MRALGSCLVLIGVLNQVASGQQTISDGTFNNADWSVSAISTTNMLVQALADHKRLQGEILVRSGRNNTTDLLS